MSRYALAVDIGGTFTDVVLRSASGQTTVDKTLTTPESLDVGFFRAIDAVLKKANVAPSAVTDVIVHATTVVTNAVIERKGPKTALLVTEGFRDILTIRDEHRYEMFDPQIEFPEPLVGRDLTFGVPERVLATGEVLTPLDEMTAAAVIEELKKKGVVSVAVSFLNAYVNPANEYAMRDLIRKHAGDMYVSISSDVAPQIREYPRTSTVVMNAYTAPITEPYLEALRAGLKQRGFANDLLIMLSNGGVIGIDVASQFPVRMVESGPAAGALAAAYFADVLGLDRLLSFDMGGTTAKACIIEDRQPLVVGDFEVDRIYRFKSGCGLPILIPSVDMIEIGAGGGSIASVSDLGLLKVGPHSAGSTPGPVAYGRGGEKPTVTDADLVLGYLSADNFLGGDMKLDRAAAERQIGELADSARNNDTGSRGRYLSCRWRIDDGCRARTRRRSRDRLSRSAIVRFRRRRAGACLLRRRIARLPGCHLSAARERAFGVRDVGDAAAARSVARRAGAALDARLAARRRHLKSARRKCPKWFGECGLCIERHHIPFRQRYALSRSAERSHCVVRE